MKLIIHTDGGARGNPGPAAVGVVIEKVNSSSLIADRKTELLQEIGKTIGETTNNVAEYTAVVEAIEEVKKQKANGRIEVPMEIQFFLDSTLVVNQLNGVFKIKDATLRALALRVRTLEQEVGGRIVYAAVPREENRHADRLVNEALDGKR